MNTTLFQYCQKLVVLSEDYSKVLLAKRAGEADYDGVYTFIGGKMETTDESMLEGMRREKNEEIGPQAHIKVFPVETYNLLFRKKDGNSMIIPHIAAVYVAGPINVSEEYSDFAWVPLQELAHFEPKIDNIPDVVDWAKRKLESIDAGQLVQI